MGRGIDVGRAVETVLQDSEAGETAFEEELLVGRAAGENVVDAEL
jgi:hypothetical protein